MHIKELPTDTRSAIIVGPDNLKVTLECDLPNGPLEHIDYHDFMRRVQERDKKLRATIQLLHDRCAILEADVADAKE